MELTALTIQITSPDVLLFETGSVRYQYTPMITGLSGHLRSPSVHFRTSSKAAVSWSTRKWLILGDEESQGVQHGTPLPLQRAHLVVTGPGGLDKHRGAPPPLISLADSHHQGHPIVTKLKAELGHCLFV